MNDETNNNINNTDEFQNPDVSERNEEAEEINETNNPDEAFEEETELDESAQIPEGEHPGDELTEQHPTQDQPSGEDALSGEPEEEEDDPEAGEQSATGLK